MFKFLIAMSVLCFSLTANAIVVQKTLPLGVIVASSEKLTIKPSNGGKLRICKYETSKDGIDNAGAAYQAVAYLCDKNEMAILKVYTDSGLDHFLLMNATTGKISVNEIFKKSSVTVLSDM